MLEVFLKLWLERNCRGNARQFGEPASKFVHFSFLGKNVSAAQSPLEGERIDGAWASLEGLLGLFLR